VRNLTTQLNWVKLRLSFFIGSSFIGLLTFPPAQALIEFLAPGYDIDVFSSEPLIRWILFCGIVGTFLTLNKKDIK
jgi:hypothetical protein